nr:uncharacterized protein LOC129163799 [Nothobranchius furzeri]
MQPYEQTQRTYRGPVKAFHRTTQKTSRSATHRPFGALHVCIAWRIYYHKLKNMHHKPNSQLLPEFPPTCDPEEWLHPTCRLPSSGSSDRNETETAPNLKHSRSYLPDLHPSSRDPNLNPELDRRSRKRPLDCDRFRDMKRAKNQFDSAPTAPQPSSYRVQTQQMSFSGSCFCSGCRFHPGPDLHPYQSALWEQVWKDRVDFYLRQKVLKDHFCNTFKDFFTSSRSFPLAVRQETLPGLLSSQEMTSSSSSSSSSWHFGNRSLLDKRQKAETPFKAITYL